MAVQRQRVSGWWRGGGGAVGEICLEDKENLLAKLLFGRKCKVVQRKGKFEKAEKNSKTAKEISNLQIKSCAAKRTAFENT